MKQRYINVPWLNANSSRNYPLEDHATKIDDTGIELPDDVIVDINLWMPESYGKIAFISSVMLTPGLVSVTICSHSTRAFQATVPLAFTPIASLSLVRPIEVYRNYKLTSSHDGIGGWITFGPGINVTALKTYRFSNPKQSEILPKLVRYYPSNGVTSMGKYGFATKLQGLIRFVSQDPDVLKVQLEDVYIDGARSTKKAIVFSLNEQVSGKDIYSKFIGPCGARPESLTCRKTPIESINGVVPDCNGTIKLYLNEKTEGEAGGLVLTDASTGTVVVTDSVVWNGTTLEFIDANLDPNTAYEYTVTNTNEEGAESPQGSPLDITTPDISVGDILTLDYATGMSDICDRVSIGFTNDKSDHCDTPCDDWSADSASPLPNICFTWYTGRVYEPRYGGPAGVFTRYSEVATFDVTGLDASANFFTLSGSCDGILMLIGEAETIVGSISRDKLYLTIPTDAIFINDNSGYIVKNAYSDAFTLYPPSVGKVLIAEGDPGTIYTFNEGSSNPSDPQSGHVADITLANTKKSFNETFTVGDLPVAWKTGNEIKLKLVHVVSGMGFANVEFQCRA